MKRNLLKSIIILLTLTFVTLQSCKKKTLFNLENEVLIEKPAYLEFSDKTTFSKALETENLRTIPTDFVSMYDIYIKIEETEDENERNMLIKKYRDILKIDKDGFIDLIITDDVLASFLSPEGLIKIGNEISLVKEDKIVTLTDGDASKINLLYQFDDDSPENNIRVDKFIQNVNTDKAYWSGSSAYNSGNYQIRWQKWASYSPWNSSAGGKIKSYKRKKNKWKIHRINLSITVSWDYIEWKNGHASTFWTNGHVSDSKYGYILSKRKYAGSGWTPNPVYGLEISGSVGGHNYQF